MPPERCSETSRELEEPLGSTASQVRRWVLVEHASPWPDRDWYRCVDEGVAALVSAYATAHDARPVLVRRPAAGGDDAELTGRVLFADCRPGHRVLAEAVADDAAAFAQLLAPAQPFAAGATARDDHVFLVCAHSTHDVCCGIRGRPVSRAAAALGVDVWECTHIGGDRFAANIVVLPHGIYYGRVAADEVGDIAQRTLDGELRADRYRGRSFLSWPSQGAERLVRTHLDEWRIDAVEQVRAERSADRTWRIEVDHPKGTALVDVREGRAPSRPLTCKSGPARPLELTTDLVAPP